MTRVLAAVLASLLTVGLASVLPRDTFTRIALPSKEGVDETLMYAISRTQSVRMRVPAGSDEVVLHVVALVPPQRRFAPNKVYALGVEATLLGPTGAKLHHWNLEIDGRMSLEQDEPRPSSRRGTHLLERNGFATDNRVVVLPMRELVASADATLVLRAGPHRYDQLRVRAFGRRPASAEPKALLETPTLDSAARRSIADIGSALGPDDLPSTAFDVYTSRRLVRLEAFGQRGKDYELERVGLSSYRRPRASAHASEELPAVKPGPHRWAALNARGPITLDLYGKPGTQIRVVDDWGSSTLDPEVAGSLTYVLDDRGTKRVQLSSPGPRTIAVYAPEGATDLRLATDAAGVGALLGAPVRFRDARGTWWLAPDVRETVYASLHPSDAVELEVEPEQRELRLEARTQRRSFDAGSPTYVEYEIVADGNRNQRARVETQLASSSFDRWDDDTYASDVARVRLDLPFGAQRVLLYGPPDTRVRALVEEPGVQEDRLETRYRVDVSEARWLHAPRELARTTPLRPSNERALAAARRVSRLFGQVRLEPTDDAASIAKRARRARQRERDASLAFSSVLEPQGTPLRQRVLMWQNVQDEMPADAWTEVSSPRQIVVDAAHRNHEVTLRPARAAIANDARVTLNGQTAAQSRVRATAWRAPLRIEEGRHTIAVEGLGEGGTAYVDAKPRHGSIVRRRTVEQLARGNDLVYEFGASPRERQQVLVQVVSEGRGGRWAFQYEVSSKPPAGNAATVEIEGRRAGLVSMARRALFWDLGASRRVGWSAARFRLATASGQITRTLRLRLAELSEGLDHVWVRTILLSNIAPRATERLRASRTRDP